MENLAVLDLLSMIRILWQPIAETSTRVLRGAEALARNMHNIEIPNISDHATALQCLAQAVLEAKRLNQLGLFASVNIEPWMINELERLIGEPEGLMFELTERDRLERPDIFKQLQARGYKIVVDDWPLGHSREHVRALASGGLVKISREHFLSSTAADLTGDIAKMRESNLRVLVEGVENEDHWNKATQVGADFVQGFHPSLGLPMPLSDLEGRFFSGNLT
jgi:EAL domain-containing protein (putative c-di-GMP-specific phosphodiesterase class I)